MAIKKKTTSRVDSTSTKTPQKGLTDNQRWVYGFILLFFALFVAASVISFYLYWTEDQDIIHWDNVFDSNGEKVLNWGGKVGAVVAEKIVSQWFGVFGICIPFALIILALRIMRYRPLLLRKAVLLSLIGMVIGSVTLGFLFGDMWQIFGTGLGGAHGIFVSRYLTSILGVVGCGLLLLLAIVIYAVYINRNTIGLINKVGKGLSENGKKIGEKVATTAAGMILNPDKQTSDTEGYKSTQESRDGADSGDESGTDNPFKDGADVVGATDNAVKKKDARVPKVDEHGFTILSPDGEFEINSESEDDSAKAEQSDELSDRVILRDEDGFEIIDYRSGGNAATEGEIASGIASGVASGVVSGAATSAESAARASAEDTSEEIDSGDSKMVGDDDDFEITYASGGDENRVVDSSPAQDERESDSDFVANVPAAMDINSADDINVVKLPSDELVDDDQIENTLFDPTLELSSYQLPPVEILEDHSVNVSVTSDEIVENKNRIKDTLENFGIKIDKIKATIGPTVTLYEIVPAPGVRISKIKNLEDDIALSLSALGIRIIAPIPGKGTIGIEVPNKDKQIVSMYSVIKSVKFQESTYDIPVVLGKTIQDETFVIDLAKMPHLLVAGATGQGKSVGLNAVIASLLYKKHPSELKLVLVDPKKVELTLYSKLVNHFLAKLPGEDDAIITDTHKVIYTLNSLCIEMDDRYNLLRQAEVRHIKEYNQKFTHRRLNPNKGHRYLPYIVVIIDEFADLIMTAGREVETPIARIAQLARAVGIHLVIATQRPTTNIITGVIKANFPARIAFRVTSMVDSRTIIDQPGANQLIGRGDMLVSTGSELIRVQCAFVDTPEIERITEFIGNQRGYHGAYELPEYNPDGASDGGSKMTDTSQLDAMFEDVARFIVQNQQGSTSSIQRRFSIGYNRAGRIMDQVEQAGIVGKAEGSKPREVLISDMQTLERLLVSIDI